LEDQERDGRITLRCIIGKLVAVMGGEWIWLRIMFTGNIYY